MSAPPAMTLPGGRVVLGWWRDLASLEPHRLWFAHLILHQVEVQVETAAVAPLALLADAVLARLAASRPRPVAVAHLASELDLDERLLGEALADLEVRGLARPDPEGWRPTEAGQQPPRSAPQRRLERRRFCFAEGPSPLFVPLAPTAPLHALPATPAGWHFDLAALEACLRETELWKARHGFPLDVGRLVRPTGSAEDWRAVAVDQPAQVLLALVEVQAPSGPAVLLGFPVRQEGWTLGREPVLHWPDGAERLGPLGADPGMEAWRHAWQVWCQQRSLPGNEVEACRLEVVGHRLRVQAPGRLVERLRAARSDALKGEAWLLAGSGRVRPAASIELVEG